MYISTREYVIQIKELVDVMFSVLGIPGNIFSRQ